MGFSTGGGGDRQARPWPRHLGEFLVSIGGCIFRRDFFIRIWVVDTPVSDLDIFYSEDSGGSPVVLYQSSRG